MNRIRKSRLAPVAMVSACLTLLAAGAAPASAQDPGQAPLQTSDDVTARLATSGWTSMLVSIREDIQICDWGGWTRGDVRRRDRDCAEGVAEVLVRTDGRRVIEIEHRPPGSSRGPSANADLGPIAAPVAARFFLGLVEDRDGDGETAEDALGTAAMVDSVTIWPDLEHFATDRSRDSEIRKAALFWLGQAAAEEATAGITRVLDEPDGEIEVKEAAVFALSQRPDSIAVPALLGVARGDYHPEVIESAFFWLSQSDDPRVVAFFREILSG